MTTETVAVGRGARMERYREIAAILMDEGLYELLTPGAFDRLFGGSGAGAAARAPEADPIEARIRRALERLGPAFIKVGQLAATRRDLIAPAMVEELQKLQDDVSAVPYEQVVQRIEEELGAPPEEVYASFEHEPLAAASIGQVHRATLPDGRLAVVKVQRPGVTEQMAVDLDILERQSRSAGKHLAMARELDVPGVASRFIEALRSELDYTREARNMELFRDRFEAEGEVAIPWVDWERTTSRVLTMEELDGIPGTRTDEMDAAGVDRVDLVKRGVGAYFVQIFELGTFHSDPHQGNLFAMADGRVGLVDFGRVSTISERFRDQALEMVMALADADDVRVAEVLIEITRADATLDRQAFQVEVTDLVDRFTSKGDDAIGLSGALERVLGMVRRYGLRMPDELAMLFITMGTLEGVARTLDPGFDFVTSAKPLVQQLLPQRWGPERLERALRRSGFRYLRLAEDLPYLVDLILRRAGSGEFQLSVRPTGTDDFTEQLESIASRLTYGVILSALILGTAILLSSRQPDEVQTLAGIVALVAIGVVAWLLYSAVRHVRRRR